MLFWVRDLLKTSRFSLSPFYLTLVYIWLSKYNARHGN